MTWYKKPKIRQAVCANPPGSCYLGRKARLYLHCKDAAFPQLLSWVFLLSPQGAYGRAANSPNSLIIIPSGLAQVRGQLTCFHLRHLSSQPLAKSSVSMLHQLPAFGETVRNPRCQPPAPLQSAPTLYSPLLLLRHYQFMVIFRAQISDP